MCIETKASFSALAFLGLHVKDHLRRPLQELQLGIHRRQLCTDLGLCLHLLLWSMEIKRLSLFKPHRSHINLRLT